MTKDEAIDREDLIDAEDGENRAVRSFLMQYSCDRSITVGAMLAHMNRSGWRGAAPAFALEVRPETHLTKGGAQLWIRHLISLEAAAPVLAAVGVEKPQQGNAIRPSAEPAGQQESTREWLPIETAPKSLHPIWLGGPRTMRAGFWSDGQEYEHHGSIGGGWRDLETGRDLNFAPTSWMPLPSLPRAEASASPVPRAQGGITKTTNYKGDVFFEMSSPSTPAPTDAGIPISDESAKFEAWMRKECGADDESLQRRADGHYSWGRTCDMYAAWQARDQQQAGVADGFVAVPKVPTQAMIDNIAAFVDHNENDAGIIYRAMIAAAPSVPGEV